MLLLTRDQSFVSVTLSCVSYFCEAVVDDTYFGTLWKLYSLLIIVVSFFEKLKVHYNLEIPHFC